MTEKGEIGYNEFCAAAEWLANVSKSVGDGWILNLSNTTVGVPQVYLSRKMCKQFWLIDESIGNKFDLVTDCCEEDDSDCGILCLESECKQLEISRLNLGDIASQHNIVTHIENTDMAQSEMTVSTKITAVTTVDSESDAHSSDVLTAVCQTNFASAADGRQSLCMCSVEHHILYSHSYCVPVVYFNIYQPGGELLSLNQLWNCTIEASFPSFTGTDLWSLVTQHEHPILHRPYFYLHPCHTASLMKHVKGSAPREYLLSWLSSIGPTVQLDLSIFYAKELKHCHASDFKLTAIQHSTENDENIPSVKD